ncbi:AAA family ATPase [Desulfospira joergensenii]|uniref:AAA family ATPase n=1 Tax=Desulfospira joergensenii TaxID=53329 RepID=UPI0003B60B1A|nr:AAA family ATPase [Desulfospira joergensenii]
MLCKDSGMEAILFTGIQAAGKSTFYKERFADTHIRINLDMLKTRHREKKLFECCLEIQQSFVIDNTNLTRGDRQRYIPKIMEHGIVLHGYYFASSLEDALGRNRLRGHRAIPEKGVAGAYKCLEPPSFDEGFSHLSRVEIRNGLFEVTRLESDPAGRS